MHFESAVKLFFVSWDWFLQIKFRFSCTKWANVWSVCVCWPMTCVCVRRVNLGEKEEKRSLKYVIAHQSLSKTLQALACCCCCCLQSGAWFFASTKLELTESELIERQVVAINPISSHVGINASPPAAAHLFIEFSCCTLFSRLTHAHFFAPTAAAAACRLLSLCYCHTLTQTGSSSSFSWILYQVSLDLNSSDGLFFFRPIFLHSHTHTINARASHNAKTHFSAQFFYSNYSSSSQREER